MGVRVGLLFLLVLATTWLNNVDARNMMPLNVLGISEFDSAKQVIEFKNDIEVDAKGDNTCTLCEQYTSLAIDYFNDNKTQKGIVDILHLGCSRMHSLKHECTKLVDYYTPLFFLEVASIEPGVLCSKLNLCYKLQLQFPSESTCKLCHEAVDEILSKLGDPDTQLEIIQILLKVCNQTEQYAKKCKKLVLTYGPLVMVDAEKYLAKNDLCSIVGLCKTHTVANEATSLAVNPTLLAES